MHVEPQETWDSPWWIVAAILWLVVVCWISTQVPR